MNNLPLTSIIVPIYNVEDYLEECLNSLINQTYTNIEIVLINDGSTDNSLRIANEFAVKDSRIVLFSQTNKGLSAARNIGVSLATGEYVLFVDSDDWIATFTCEHFIKIAIESNSDIVVGNVLCFNEESKYTYPYIISRSTIQENIFISGLNFFSEVIRKNIYTVMVYNYFYKYSFLIENNLKFENIIHEDELWTPTALYFANKVVYTNLNFYYYRQRVDSIMQSAKANKRIESILFIISDLYAFISRIPTNKKNSQNDIRDFIEAIIYKINELFDILFQLLCLIKEGKYCFILDSFPLCKLDYWKNLPTWIKIKYSDNFSLQLQRYRKLVLSMQKINL